jgi:(5-formylfuran-3-yl)methyl phosphate synthase
MNDLIAQFERPGLLVSVRDVREALAALAGGADVIDVKEPTRGSLGAAEVNTIAAIVEAVNGRATVTAALGELIDLIETQNDRGSVIIPTGVSHFKIGFAGCAEIAGWKSCWERAVKWLTSAASGVAARPVAVVYADWHAARSPQPHEVLAAAIELNCSALLIDTWKKSAGSLFDLWSTEELICFLAKVRSQNLAVVLAGSLSGESIEAALKLGPNLIAVRGAACEGGRTGAVAAERVRQLKLAIAAAQQGALV